VNPSMYSPGLQQQQNFTAMASPIPGNMLLALLYNVSKLLNQYSFMKYNKTLRYIYFTSSIFVFCFFVFSKLPTNKSQFDNILLFPYDVAKLSNGCILCRYDAQPSVHPYDVWSPIYVSTYGHDNDRSTRLHAEHHILWQT